jgi:hypothetical protein
VSTPAPFTGSDGYTTYTRLYVVSDVQTRTPDDAQKRQLRDGAFTNWYAAVKADPTQADIAETP